MSNPITNAKIGNPVTKPRITYQLNVYHQIMGEDAKQYPFNGDCFREVEETPYERSVTIVDQYVQLDLGFLAAGDIGSLLITNITGNARTVKPTPEEMGEDASAIVVINELPNIHIIPKMPPLWLHFGPDFSGLSLRSLGAPARIRYVGFPR